VTPEQLAETFARILGRPVKAEAVPRASWESLFRSQGMENPEPRIRMLDGFNEGWIEFQGDEAASRKGETALETVLKALVDGAEKS
jgi:NAD(P)H dehydrogenase (quinone)